MFSPRRNAGLAYNVAPLGTCRLCTSASETRTCPPLSKTASEPKVSSFCAATSMSPSDVILHGRDRALSRSSASARFGVITCDRGSNSSIRVLTASGCNRTWPDVEMQTGSQTRGIRPWASKCSLSVDTIAFMFSAENNMPVLMARTSMSSRTDRI